MASDLHRGRSFRIHRLYFCVRLTFQIRSDGPSFHRNSVRLGTWWANGRH